MPEQPYQFQQDAIQRIRDMPMLLHVGDCGVGKTMQALLALDDVQSVLTLYLLEDGSDPPV